jgi:hypothetical protein
MRPRDAAFFGFMAGAWTVGLVTYFILQLAIF